jgi:hypothetical protein
VADDQLVAAVEQIDQPHLAVGTLEAIVLLNRHHRQPAPRRRELVAGAGQLLLLRQQPPARGLPLGFRHDLRQAHGTPPRWSGLLQTLERRSPEPERGEDGGAAAGHTATP